MLFNYLYLMGNINNKIKPKGNVNKKNNFILGIIDPQNDFFEGGSLAVPHANQILAPINKLRFAVFDLMRTFVTLDYHPPDHISFASTHNKEPYSNGNIQVIMKDNSCVTVEQTFWPDHCISNMPGAQIHTDLLVLNNDKIFHKGKISDVESYSGFGDQFNNSIENTGLHTWLKIDGITDILLVGLAMDYCVYFTALDALSYGYRVHIILSCIRGVKEETTDKAISDLTAKGVEFYKTIKDFTDIFKN